MADRGKAESEKKKKMLHGFKILLVFGTSLISNTFVNSFVGVNLYIHRQFFASDPGREFLEICTEFQSLQKEILDIQAFILPFFASYWLIDIISDFLLLYVLLKRDFSPVMVLLKVVNMVLFLYVGVYYILISANVDRKLIFGFCVFLVLKVGLAFCTIPGEVKRIRKRMDEKRANDPLEVKKIELKRKRQRKENRGNQKEYVNGELYEIRQRIEDNGDRKEHVNVNLCENTPLGWLS